jgi:hypothetical protein
MYLQLPGLVHRQIGRAHPDAQQRHLNQPKQEERDDHQGTTDAFAPRGRKHHDRGHRLPLAVQLLAREIRIQAEVIIGHT